MCPLVRLLRLMRLAAGLRKVVNTMTQSAEQLVHLLCILVIVMLIFALLGMRDTVLERRASDDLPAGAQRMLAGPPVVGAAPGSADELDELVWTFFEGATELWRQREAAQRGQPYGHGGSPYQHRAAELQAQGSPHWG